MIENGGYTCAYLLTDGEVAASFIRSTINATPLSSNDVMRYPAFTANMCDMIKIT